jgi:hypothetical protein
MREARAEGPLGTGPSAAFGKWLSAFLLRVAIEVAVAVLNQLQEAG